MNNIALGLRSLTRKRKLAILVLADFCIALSCWVVFGPPLSFMIASNFEISLIEIMFKNYLIGEITCPTKYFDEASSINFQRSSIYGIGVIITSVKYFLTKTKIISWKILK